MKQSKITHYKISITERFLAGHPRAGEPTLFKDQIILDRVFGNGKIHTIRQNYPLWVKRMEKVHAGKAVIDLCEWKLPGGRFNPDNELIPFVTLDKDSGCGVQKLDFYLADISQPMIFESKRVFIPFLTDLSNNDGLSFNDFYSWFMKYDRTQPMAIIQFTSFRY